MLSSIVGKSVLDLYRDVQTIKDRDLIQSRDVWRAVLPPAIANRLAKRALESIPKNTVVKSFINSGSERIMKSFSRRLNYLHDCDAAKSIVEEWLKNDGWIGKKIDQLNLFEMEVFKNISPVSPVLTLKAIERASNSEIGIGFTSRENVHYSSFVRILRHLAYDQNFFIRSVNIMCHFALSEKPDEKNNSTRDAIKSLFYIRLSGTHAPIEERVKVIELLIDSDDGEKQALGMSLLNAALNARSVSTSREFNFGARSRDFGCIPKTYEDVFHWYKTVIDICSRMALSEQLISESARKVLSSNLRFLWRKGGIHDVLFDAIKSIHEQKSWSDAWISVCEIIRYDSKTFSDNDLEKINKLERLLRPAGLLERVRTYVLTEKNIPDIDDDMGGSNEWEKTLNLTKKLGEEVAQDSVVLTELLPELISINNNKLLSFGEGVSDGCSDNKVLWGLLCNQYKITLPEKRNINILLGFLSSCAKNDSEFYQSTLDGLLEDDQLGEWFVSFQIITAIDERALTRLHKSLDIGKVHLNSYRSIAWGRTYKPVSDENLSTLLKKIISIDGGTKSAIEILSMRFYGVQGNKSEPEYSITLINVAREVLSSHLFSDESHPDSISYNPEILVKVCLHGPNAVSSAKSLCENIERAISEGRIYVFDYIELLSVLALVQPFVFLDVFLGDTSMSEYRRGRVFLRI